MQSHISAALALGRGPSTSSKIAYLDKRSFADQPSRITVIELYEPIPPPQTCCEILKGILIMKFAIVNLAISGIFVKAHYEYNPQVTIYDMVFVRAFS